MPSLYDGHEPRKADDEKKSDQKWFIESNNNSSHNILRKLCTALYFTDWIKRFAERFAAAL